MGNGTPPTPAQWRMFFKTYSDTLDISRACNASGIPRTTFYRWKREVKWVADRFEESRTAAVDNLEAAAYKRAVSGVDEVIPLTYQGEVFGERIKTTYSDTLAVRILEAHRPERYKPAQETPKDADRSAAELSEAELLQIANSTPDEADPLDDTVIDVTDSMHDIVQLELPLDNDNS